jgi:hypothetical protein
MIVGFYLVVHIRGTLSVGILMIHPERIADIIGCQNAVLQSFPKEIRSILRPAVIEEHGGEDIHVYQATGDYAEYRVFTRNCLSFAKYIIGDHSEKLNDFDDPSFTAPWRWFKE